MKRNHQNKGMYLFSTTNRTIAARLCITRLLALLLMFLPTTLLAGVVGQSPMYGGNGIPFTDTSTNYQPLTGVQVRAGAIIDAIQAVSPQNYAIHGGVGGNLYSITLNLGEYITGISGENCDFQFDVNRLVSKISFVTNQSRTFGPYGTSSYCSNITSFNYTVPAGNQVLGFYGNSGQYLNAIGVIYGTIDPLAYYAMDEKSWSGTTGEVIDSSGNGYNATAAYRTGSTYPTNGRQPQALTGSPGTCNYGAFTDQQYLSLPPAMPHLSGNFSVSAWFNTANAGQVNQRIISDDQNNSGGYALTLNGNGVTGNLQFIQRPSFSLTTNYAFQSNTWYFVGVSASASSSTITMLIYNQAGTLIASNTGSNNSLSSETGGASIGAEAANSSEILGFNGFIDEARLYRTALSNAEIATLSQLRHSCPVYSYNAANMNCVAVGTTGNTGHLYTQLAATAFNVDVVALKSDGSVETDFAAAGNKNVTLEFVDGSGNTVCGSRAMLNPAISQTVSFTATDSGRKTVSTTVGKAYRDLRCRVTDANQSPSLVTCSGDDFAVRPTSLTVTSSNANADSAGTSTTATPAIRAGNNFSLTATANAANYDGTPSINSSAIQPHTGATQTGNLNGVFAAAIAASSTASGSAFAYSEVGYFRFNINGLYDNTFTAIDAANGDCTAGFSASGGVNACNFGNTATTSYFGRFTPDHFAVSPSTTAPACSNNFTYFGQDGLVTNFTLTAQNTTNITTQNYTGSFAKLGLTTWANYNFSASPLPTGSSLSASTTAPSGVWNNGSANISAKHLISRPTAATAPTNITISAAPVDSDGVTMASSAVSTASNFKYGRLYSPNTYGSELLPLNVPIEAQYWNGTAYQRNQQDSCSVIPTTSIAMGNYKNNLVACETALTGAGTMSAGKVIANLSKPGSGNNGSVDLTVNINSAAGSTCTPTATTATSAAIPWFGTNTSSRATFGLFRTPVIYIRENF